MTSQALEKIAAELEAVAAELRAGHAVDAYNLKYQARRIIAQAEMIEEGIAE